jgi:hypothetical protein
MKALISFITPITLLIIACAILEASWPYYIISFSVGSGIGALALFTWLQIKKSDDYPVIKIEEKKK